jgi:hypothetical protein
LARGKERRELEEDLQVEARDRRNAGMTATKFGPSIDIQIQTLDWRFHQIPSSFRWVGVSHRVLPNGERFLREEIRAVVADHEKAVRNEAGK